MHKFVMMLDVPDDIAEEFHKELMEDEGVGLQYNGKTIYAEIF